MSAGDQVSKASVEGNELSRIDQLEREIAALRAQVMNLGRLDEATENIGNVTQGEWRFTDDEDKLRMIISAINLLEEFGISAHFAGFDEFGRPTFWADADQGDIRAAGGAVAIGGKGILLTGSSNAFEIRDPDEKARSYIYQHLGSLRLITLKSTDDVDRIDNGDFETGDLTDWTETDPSSLISVVFEDGKYACKFEAGADHTTDHIRQTMFPLENGAFIVIRYKNNGTDVGHIFVSTSGGGAVVNDIYVRSSEWATTVIWVNEEVSLLYLGADVAAGDTMYVDSIEVFERANNTPQASVVIGDEAVSLNGQLFFNGVEYTPGGGLGEILDSVEVGAGGSTYMSLAVGSATAYKMMDVWWSARSDIVATNDFFRARINGDSSNLYDWVKVVLRHNGVITTTEGLADDHLEVGICTGSTAPSDDFGQGYIRFVDPSSGSKNKDGQSRTVVRLGTTTGLIRLYDFALHYRSLDTIQTILLFAGAGNDFVEGSKAYLIGYR